ncbi:MAG: hypothetical protein LBE67_07425 [Kocuria palustris]|nr:hypothetical protein [Kocuria palustris]
MPPAKRADTGGARRRAGPHGHPTDRGLLPRTAVRAVTREPSQPRSQGPVTESGSAATC